jgi:hypothetical protein
MSRLLSPLPGLALLTGLALLAGCSPSRPPSAVPGSPAANLALPPPGGPAAPGGVPPGARLPPPRQAAAPQARPIPETPLGEGRLSNPAALAAACRDLADRMLVQQDRGDLMREDERDSRLGTYDSPYQFSAPNNRMGRQFERDRIARDCVTRNSRAAPDR